MVKDVPLIVLQYLRDRLTAANNKEAIHGTRLGAPNRQIASGITKLSNLIHKQYCTTSEMWPTWSPWPEGRVWHRCNSYCCYYAATTPGLLKAILNCLYVREIDVVPLQLGVVIPDNF